MWRRIKRDRVGREGEIGREGERVSQTPFVWLTVLTYMLTNIVNCGKQEKSEILWRRKTENIYKKKKMGGKWKFRKIVYNGMYVRKFTQKLKSGIKCSNLNSCFALLSQLENWRQLCAPKSAVRYNRRTRRIFATITISLWKLKN